MDFFSSLTNPNIINISQNQPQLRKYWCHLCKKDFSHVYDDKIDINCIYCGKTFCELLLTNDILDESHPIHFRPYILNENNINNDNYNNVNRDEDNNNRNRNTFFTFFPSFIISHIIRHHTEDNIDNLINEIMQNDTNKYGNPPASKNAIEKLKKCKINEEKLKEFGIENSCAVCKDELNIGEICLLMPCNHHFHENCLIPWLKERNSCPICRYELPTDDEDFELRKKQKIINNRNNFNDENIHN